MTFGAPPTSITPRESKNCKIEYRNIFARNIPDVDHCNVPALLYLATTDDVMSSNPKNYDALRKHPMTQRQSKTLFGVLQSTEESG
jgi:hypothetical protein